MDWIHVTHDIFKRTLTTLRVIKSEGGWGFFS